MHAAWDGPAVGGDTYATDAMKPRALPMMYNLSHALACDLGLMLCLPTSSQLV